MVNEALQHLIVNTATTLSFVPTATVMFCIFFSISARAILVRDPKVAVTRAASGPSGCRSVRQRRTRTFCCRLKHRVPSSRNIVVSTARGGTLPNSTLSTTWKLCVCID